MNPPVTLATDPIVPELLRSRLEAIGQEASAAVQQTAISPIVTESKDYSVTILDGEGSIISASGLIDTHFGAVMNAVRSTVALHGGDIAEGDVFISNDPHNGGGLHPQDIVIQRPVFFEGERVAWVALAAHMMDMGGMVPGSSAAEATECYQEALRLPPVRLARRHVECEDIWNIMRINIRSSDLVEMDMRSLVIGGAVAEAKLVDLLKEIGLDTFRAASLSLLSGVLRVLRERISRLADGHYRATAWVEFRNDVLRVPCDLEVVGDRLIFDLSAAPPQVPHYFNSKEYIIRAMLAPLVRQVLAPGLPFNQSILDVVEIISKPGTLVNCVMPAPIGAAHTDATITVNSAAAQCLQFALYASPGAQGRDHVTGPPLGAYTTGRWTYLDEAGVRRVYTLIDGSFSGSPAAGSRDGIDIKGSQIPGGNKLEYADVEILENAYPVLFRERKVTTGFHGYGRFRSGAGFQESFEAHSTDTLVGNMTGTRAWFPTAGAAGGYSGATVKLAVRRADGRVEAVGIQQVGGALAPGDRFEMICACGGGFGDPLDRDADAVALDLADERIDADVAREIYGVVFLGDAVDVAATERLRGAIRRDRLDRARPADRPVDPASIQPDQDGVADLPFYPGVVQRGRLAVAETSGSLLAVAPNNWLEGCAVLDTLIDDRVGGVLTRVYLDPADGRALHVEVLRVGDGPSIEIRPERWRRLEPVRRAAARDAEPVDA